MENKVFVTHTDDKSGLKRENFLLDTFLWTRVDLLLKIKNTQEIFYFSHIGNYSYLFGWWMINDH